MTGFSDIFIFSGEIRISVEKDILSSFDEGMEDVAVYAVYLKEEFSVFRRCLPESFYG